MSVDRSRLAELKAPELQVLAQLIGLFIRADREFTEQERSYVNQLDQDTGGLLWELLGSVEDTSLASTAALVEARDAQELIYGTLYELSIIDGVGSSHNSMLEQLSLGWGISIQILRPTGPGGPFR